MTTFIGAAVLNGPPGASDTPEMFVPKEAIGEPTECAIEIHACTVQQAHDRQIVWHALMCRAASIRRQDTVPQYGAAKRAVMDRLMALADKVLCEGV